jgi:hypothetical protein
VDPTRQWCENTAGADFAKTEGRNLKVPSYLERRFYCTTGQHTCSFDKGTFLETLRTERQPLWEAVAMLVERNSLRAICRIKQGKLQTVLHWLDLAGQHAAAISTHFLRGLHLTQAQIDALWSFVKKKQEHLQPHDPRGLGDTWIWKALAVPSPLLVVTHRSHDRSEKEATTFWVAFKARTDGRPPLFTSDKLPATDEKSLA